MSLSKVDEDLKRKAKKQMNEKVNDPVEKCRLTLLARGTSGIKNLGRQFRIMDDDGNKQLNFDEFKTGMRDFGVKSEDVSDAELKEVYERFDTDGSGGINVTEFLIKLQPRMSEAREKLVLEAFEKLDKSGDGVITTEDLTEYNVSQHPKYLNGEWTRKQCLQEFLKNFDDKKHADGKITKQEFIAYYSAISCSIDNDAYFDLMMRQAWP